jgi:hypothetical protein
VSEVSFVVIRLEAGFIFMDGMEPTGKFDVLLGFGHASLVRGEANFAELLPAVSVWGGTSKSEAIPANGGGQGGRGLLKISESQPDIVGSGDGIRNFWNPV